MRKYIGYNDHISPSLSQSFCQDSTAVLQILGISFSALIEMLPKQMVNKYRLCEGLVMDYVGMDYTP